MKVSRLMSTQHPDNVKPPFFSDNNVLGGDEEIKEAFYTYSHIDCKEQLWDYEGKEVDNHVVKKLLTRYESFFRKQKLGKDLFLTYRVPNPEVEKHEAKVLLETLDSIPRSFDVAKLFYGEDIAPVFEVSVPMVSSYETLARISEYYRKMIIGQTNKSLLNDGFKISDWIGEFKPEDIRMIPLFEDKKGITESSEIVKKYIETQKVSDYQRVWIARSDPALNYGSLSAVILAKIAMQNFEKVAEETSVDILPILGCGSAPFRGNFKPTNVEGSLAGFPSVHTFTIQSAFKYDFPIKTVENAVNKVNETKTKKAIPVDEEKLKLIFEKVSAEYIKQIRLLSGTINDFSKFIPPRRKRKLHIGLFGYSREGGGVKLPRAITFCATLYSLGLPPDILGLNALNSKDKEYISEFYPCFDEDLKDSFQFFNEDNLNFFPHEVVKGVKKAIGLTEFEVDEEHKKVTSQILEDYWKKNFSGLQENINMGGLIRGYLG